MTRLKVIFGAIVLLLSTIAFCDELAYPDAVTISRFETEKVIYKPGDKVVFNFDLNVRPSHQQNTIGKTEIQIWLERELDKPYLGSSKIIKLKSGAQSDSISWTSDKSVFGHRATLRIIDGYGRVLAENETLFDVAQKWTDVMRLAACGADQCGSPAITDKNIGDVIDKMRKGYFNAFESYTFSPKPYHLAPREDDWGYQHNAKKKISKERLIAWSKMLHKVGIKYVAYNESTAVDGPDDWKVYLKENGFDKPVAHYFEDKGMFTPNSIKIADYFAEQLAASIQMFGWDGILMDSAIDGHIQTARGFSKDKRNLTDLSVGEVGAIYLAKAAKMTRELNPDFSFLSQNATSISHTGVRLAPETMYPWIKANAERMQIRKYSDLVDLYTLEIDAHHEPRDGRYPLTYEKMSIALNSIVEATGKPLMSWGFLVTPFYDEYSVAFTRPYMALLYASRTKLHDHFDFYGGALSDGSDSPVSKQFIKYNRFAARFSYYLWNPKFRWLLDPSRFLKVAGTKPVFWNQTVYQMENGPGNTLTVINLLNLPSNGTILSQKEIPEPFLNGTLTFLRGFAPDKVTFLNADSDSLEPLVLTPSNKSNEFVRYNIPPVESWSLVVVERKGKLE